jgi:hypothetical protein
MSLLVLFAAIAACSITLLVSSWMTHSDRSEAGEQSLVAARDAARDGEFGLAREHYAAAAALLGDTVVERARWTHLQDSWDDLRAARRFATLRTWVRECESLSDALGLPVRTELKALRQRLSGFGRIDLRCVVGAQAQSLDYEILVAAAVEVEGSGSDLGDGSTSEGGVTFVPWSRERELEHGRYLLAVRLPSGVSGLVPVTLDVDGSASVVLPDLDVGSLAAARNRVVVRVGGPDDGRWVAVEPDPVDEVLFTEVLSRLPAELADEWRAEVLGDDTPRTDGMVQLRPGTARALAALLGGHIPDAVEAEAVRQALAAGRAREAATPRWPQPSGALLQSDESAARTRFLVAPDGDRTRQAPAPLRLVRFLTEKPRPGECSFDEAGSALALRLADRDRTVATWTVEPDGFVRCRTRLSRAATSAWLERTENGFAPLPLGVHDAERGPSSTADLDGVESSEGSFGRSRRASWRSSGRSASPGDPGSFGFVDAAQPVVRLEHPGSFGVTLSVDLRRSVSGQVVAMRPVEPVDRSCDDACLSIERVLRPLPEGFSQSFDRFSLELPTLGDGYGPCDVAVRLPAGSSIGRVSMAPAWSSASIAQGIVVFFDDVPQTRLRLDLRRDGPLASGVRPTDAAVACFAESVASLLGGGMESGASTESTGRRSTIDRLFEPGFLERPSFRSRNDVLRPVPDSSGLRAGRDVAVEEDEQIRIDGVHVLADTVVARVTRTAVDPGRDGRLLRVFGWRSQLVARRGRGEALSALLFEPVRMAGDGRIVADGYVHDRLGLRIDRARLGEQTRWAQLAVTCPDDDTPRVGVVVGPWTEPRVRILITALPSGALRSSTVSPGVAASRQGSAASVPTVESLPAAPPAAARVPIDGGEDVSERLAEYWLSGAESARRPGRLLAVDDFAVLEVAAGRLLRGRATDWQFDAALESRAVGPQGRGAPAQRERWVLLGRDLEVFVLLRYQVEGVDQADAARRFETWSGFFESVLASVELGS